MGANLFEVVFDLSFRRQGSLLVYDPNHMVGEQILNTESILCADYRCQGEPALHSLSNTVRRAASNGTADTVARMAIRPETGQSMIVHSIADLSVGRKAGSLRRKRRLIEMSGVDGAVVFDDDRLLAVGALIRSHPEVGNHLGARAPRLDRPDPWGGRPIKVSSDGDVTIHFKSSSGKSSCDAVMNFL